MPIEMWLNIDFPPFRQMLVQRGEDTKLAVIERRSKTLEVV